MATGSQSYKLLENGEPAEAANELDIEAVPPLSKRRRRFLEFMQSIKDYIGYTNKREGGLKDRVPAWLAPFSNCWTWTFIVSGMLLAIFIVLVVANAVIAEPLRDDILQHIDPLIGTGGGGHVFAGATLPFGMAKPVADVSMERFGGFASDRSNVVGFSSLHDSGTGGSPSMVRTVVKNVIEFPDHLLFTGQFSNHGTFSMSKHIYMLNAKVLSSIALYSGVCLCQSWLLLHRTWIRTQSRDDRFT